MNLELSLARETSFLIEKAVKKIDKIGMKKEIKAKNIFNLNVLRDLRQII